MLIGTSEVTMYQCYPPGGPVETEEQAEELKS